MYWYLTVRSDRRYGESVPTRVLVRHLDSEPGLRRTDLAFYQAEDGLDWLNVTIAACDGAGNHAVQQGRVPQQVNMVELICSAADGPAAYDAALTLAARIADLLGWEVADSETDEVLYTRTGQQSRPSPVSIPSRATRRLGED